MNIVLLGPPGSGKGTQAHKLRDAYGLTLITSGDLCRQEAALDTERGRTIKIAMEKGELFSDEIMISMIQDKVATLGNKGFILDGFPRTLPQADALEKMLAKLNVTLDAAVEIRVDEKQLIDRILGRISCKACGEVYHATTRPPKQDGVCDVCGSFQLERRADDREETLLKRLRVYSTLTAPLIPYYEGKGLLRIINGSDPVDVVFNNIEKLMGTPHVNPQKSIGI